MRATTALAVAYRKSLGSIAALGVLFATLLAVVAVPVMAVTNAASDAKTTVSLASKNPNPGNVTFYPKPNRAKNKEKRVKPCRNALVLTLRNAGFKGSNLREAWAIAMRESHGKPRVISSTWDVGLFQFNRAAHSKQDWWNVEKLRTARYSAKIAYEMSDGGRTWYPWGLDGKGNVKAHIYRNIGWSDAKIKSHIVDPFQKQLRAFDKLPASCKK